VSEIPGDRCSVTYRCSNMLSRLRQMYSRAASLKSLTEHSATVLSN